MVRPSGSVRGPATAFCPVDKTIFRHGNGAIQLKFLPLSWHEEWA